MGKCLDCEKLGIKLDEFESSPNKSLKSLTVSVLGLKSGSDLGIVGSEGTGGRGRGGMS